MDIQDKSLSIAFNIGFLSLFAMLPSPIIYGQIIDKSCILWQSTCGGDTGNCLLYDSVMLRRRLMFTTAGIMLFGLLADIAVCYEAKHLLIFNLEQKRRSKVTKMGMEQIN